MNAASSSFGFTHRLCRTAAGLSGVLGLVLLWTGLGLSDRAFVWGEASAGSVAASLYGPPHSLISKEQAASLQASVDSAALSLGGMLAAGGEKAEREAFRAAVAPALSALTFGLGGEVYYTLWEESTALHAPLSPDAGDVDFANALDGRGAPFVLGMAHVAAEGGGFLQVLLPRQFSGAEQGAAFAGDASEAKPGAAPEGLRPLPASASPLFDGLSDVPEVLGSSPDYCLVNSFALPCGGQASPPAPASDLSPVEQLVYVRQIPGSSWHIAAFMPVQASAEIGLSSLWDLGMGKSEDVREGLYRRGLCISGFSLAGLAGLMLFSGRSRTRLG